MIEKIIVEGLREMSETAFPRKCPNCEREYASLEEFIKETQPLRGRSGLMENRGCPEEGDEPIVELYRNCICGSTLMEFFSNRRDNSEKGQRRREVFAELLTLLVDKGVPREDARHELLELLHARKSELLENLGIRVEIEQIGVEL